MSKQFESGFAVIVGVGQDLPVTVQDARAIHQFLTSPEFCAYPEKNVKLLVEGNASRQKVLDALDWLASQVKSKEDATAIVYYSGHGAEKPACLLTNGYDLEKWADTTVSSVEFSEKLQAIHSKKLLVLLDCCHAGAQGDVKSLPIDQTPIPLPDEAIERFHQGQGRAILASSRRDEKSYTGNPYSIFTTALLEGLLGMGASYSDGYCRVIDIYTWVSRFVPIRSNEQQHPDLKVKKFDDFIVSYYAGSDPIPKSPPWELTTSVMVADKSTAARDALMADMERVFDGLIPAEKNRVRAIFTWLSPRNRYGGKVDLGINQMLNTLMRSVEWQDDSGANTLPKELVFVYNCLECLGIADANLVASVKRYVITLGEERHIAITDLNSVLEDSKMGIEHKADECWSLTFVVQPVFRNDRFDTVRYRIDSLLRNPYMQLVFDPPPAELSSTGEQLVTDLEDWLRDKINQAADYLELSKLRIDVFLPDEFLAISSQRFNDLQIPLIRHSFNRTFGIRIQGVLKKHPGFGRWQLRSGRLQKNVQDDRTMGSTEYQILPRTNLPAAVPSLSDEILLIGIESPLTERDSNALSAILEKGVPVVVWPQAEPITTPIWKVVLNKIAFKQIRDRMTGGQDNPFALLWDNHYELKHNEIPDIEPLIVAPTQGAY